MTRIATIRAVLSGAALALVGLGTHAQAPGPDRVALNGFAIDRHEVTIFQFTEFARATGLTTAAEREGGGHEWGQGWERRAGWSFRRPFGAAADSIQWPAVHVSWNEARAYCAWAGGRLPTRAEWTSAAYTEQGGGAQAGFTRGRTYPYPTGDTASGANTNGTDRWPRLAAAGTTRPGVNGLYDMGANAWEWLADRRGDDALTAGGSWWYGEDQMRAESMQWKPATFYAVYVGLRCVYDARR